MAKKPVKTNWVQVGHYAFFLGAILAIITGLFKGMIPNEVVITLLAALGVIVGLLNITVKERTQFLVATIALMLGGVVVYNTLEEIFLLGPYLQNIFTSIVVFVVPAAIIVGLKAVYSLAKEA